ncbi:hypothetical protein [Pontibacter indicus]|uniref:hypothetical protein n=1 Tax=Pontibacter indicus TaxID=1317125 RepID=UPI00147B18DF|nr:hypothetical protein [Pontibacter indicus]
MKKVAVPGAPNDTPLFERSASLEGLDFFAFFLCQDKKKVPAAQAKLQSSTGCYTYNTATSARYRYTCH